MAKFTYTPDIDVKVHEEGAIKLLCKPFSSHEAGLPEWLKNAADAYAREDAPEDRRVIVVIFDSGRSRSKPSISVLDVSGMTSNVIENDFRIWADPEAATRGARAVAVQGGHGNGGKCYMTQMFEDHALVHTVKEGQGNRYGVQGGSFKFGYIPDREAGRDFPVADLKSELEGLLVPLRSPMKILPPEVQRVIDDARGFTLVTGVGPKGYDTRIPASKLVQSLIDHPQMIQTLELCTVFVVVNGTLFDGGQALTLPAVTPMEGAEEPRVIPIPDTLKDPVSEQDVQTQVEGGEAGSLTLRTSDKDMRWSRKGRHNIIYRSRSGYIGYVPVVELDVESPYRNRMYGECQLQTLEPFKQNDRSRLATSPLTRAIEQWVSEQVEAYAKEFEARDRRRYNRDEKNVLSKMNEALDQWKNKFLSEVLRGLWGPDGTITPPPPPPPLPTGTPVRLELSLSHPRAGVGVAFRPSLRFFDDKGRPIRPVPYHWVSEDTNVAMVDQDLMVVNTFSHGITSICAETDDGKLVSNKVELEVVRIIEIQIMPLEIELPAGTRRSLRARCHLASGEESDDLYLVWTEGDPNIARVSSSGLVFGFGVGQTEVVAGDDGCLSKEAAVIKVIEGTGGKGKGDKPGRGFPRVLISEVDPDPETGEIVTFSREDPPIAQRPQDVDRNIWWINSSAPLARMYLDVGKDYGYESREWRMYILERYIEVMVQIAFTHGPTEAETLTVGDWLLRWGAQAAQIQAGAAAALSDFIATGLLPGTAS